ncbi:Hypothetical predicted protein [Pelobates cultripes]|uniref:Uncharacterized protein n=1 Tax=Pelobates cultripes TaxID=61616 RepID=A0AAD1S0W1_PELCU|nr:Hypothetical predicted protein [Pelobates cultripes]
MRRPLPRVSSRCLAPPPWTGGAIPVCTSNGHDAKLSRILTPCCGTLSGSIPQDGRRTPAPCVTCQQEGACHRGNYPPSSDYHSYSPQDTIIPSGARLGDDSNGCIQDPPVRRNASIRASSPPSLGVD